MRILHIMAGRGLGGAETYSTDIMLSLQARGIDQCAVYAEDAPRYAELVLAGVRTAPGVLAFPLRPLQKWRLRKVIEAEKPDLIHCWMRRAASLMSAWNGGPVIGWFGGYYDPRNFKYCDEFVGVTADIVEHMRQKGVAKERSHYVPTFPDIREEIPASREALQTPAEAPVFLALSRLHQKKGLDTFLHAAAQTPGAYLWLAGEGPLRSELEALTKKLGLEDRVRFLGWRTDRGALLRAADVCVLPSRYEPFGTVILEAWAAGTPLIAAASAGPAGHVHHEQDGLLVPIDDAEALAQAMARVIQDKPLREKMIASGRAAYQAGFTREAVTDQMIALYEKLIARHDSRAQA